MDHNYSRPTERRLSPSPKKQNMLLCSKTLNFTESEQNVSNNKVLFNVSKSPETVNTNAISTLHFTSLTSSAEKNNKIPINNSSSLLLEGNGTYERHEMDQTLKFKKVGVQNATVSRTDDENREFQKRLLVFKEKALQSDSCVQNKTNFLPECAKVDESHRNASVLSSCTNNSTLTETILGSTTNLNPNTDNETFQLQTFYTCQSSNSSHLSMENHTAVTCILPADTQRSWQLFDFHGNLTKSVFSMTKPRLSTSLSASTSTVQQLHSINCSILNQSIACNTSKLSSSEVANNLQVRSSIMPSNDSSEHSTTSCKSSDMNKYHRKFAVKKSYDSIFCNEQKQEKFTKSLNSCTLKTKYPKRSTNINSSGCLKSLQASNTVHDLNMQLESNLYNVPCHAEKSCEIIGNKLKHNEQMCIDDKNMLQQEIISLLSKVELSK